ncbi:MAG TPA: helix-turn-helix transcriptional regulator, partial [Candidatus Faecivivens stercoravium]|nr:helix-turn-helix transcriptional regulator [Candidatus Faecivivens stercoravium]
MGITFSELGQAIAGKREALGISREELAGRLGIKPKTVEKWEAGKKAPRFRQLAPL